MDFEESPLLHEPDLMLAVLRVAATEAGTLGDCVEHLRVLRRTAQVNELVPEAEVRARLQRAEATLRRAGLIELGAGGRLRITARGRRVLAKNPDGVDATVLMRRDEARPVNGHRATGAPQRAPSTDYQRGYGAYLAGAGLAENPYPRDIRAYLDWENGWSQARDDEEIS
jgi:restriction system protein